MFSGSMVALVTPMHQDGTIDFKNLKELIEWHIDAKTDGIIAAGTTGESATLEHEEQYELISFIVKQVRGRIPVIAGAGTNSTLTTLKLADAAKKAGADGGLIVTPYYNKPSQNGMYHHFKAVAEKVSMPIILYNVPARTACDLLPETVERLSKVKNIVGIKEATGNIQRTTEIIGRCDKRFEVYSGDDPTAFELMRQGARGVISVTANVAPNLMHLMCKAILEGKAEHGESINQKLSLLHKRLFLESNPIPTKWALNRMGKIANGIRLPLMPLDSRYHEQVQEAMQSAGVT